MYLQAAKCTCVLVRNTEIQQSARLGKSVLSGKHEREPELSSHDLAFFKYARITLSDVEWRLSRYKSILGDS